MLLDLNVLKGNNKKREPHHAIHLFGNAPTNNDRLIIRR